jgi:hypothetical protein
MQLFTQVEAFSSAISKLQELGLSVNVEESELVYRGTAGGLPGCFERSVQHSAPAHGLPDCSGGINAAAPS